MNLEASYVAVSKFVRLPGGLRLEYLEYGTGTGTPAVLLHGVTDSCRSFEPVLPLLPATLRVLALSQRGHGDSDRPESGYGYSDLSGDLAAFLDALGIDKAVIIGHSMGAMVAQRFAIDHPTRVAGLMLIGAFSTLYNDGGIAAFVASSIDPLGDPISAEFAREWQLSTTARPIDPEFLDIVIRETVKVPARVWRAAFHGFLETPDFSAELGRLAVPVSILWGDQDTYALRGHQEALLAAMPHARFLVYEGGHALHWEQPAAVAGAIGAFMNV
ncbi:MAG: alpha/beta hydrolase [Bryobacterales bacterium]|nr:alpha/beta hydrolase [Bryobacterales bacterium]